MSSSESGEIAELKKEIELLKKKLIKYEEDENVKDYVKISQQIVKMEIDIAKKEEKIKQSFDHVDSIIKVAQSMVREEDKEEWNREFGHSIYPKNFQYIPNSEGELDAIDFTPISENINVNKNDETKSSKEDN